MIRFVAVCFLIAFAVLYCAFSPNAYAVCKSSWVCTSTDRCRVYINEDQAPPCQAIKKGYFLTSYGNQCVNAAGNGAQGCASGYNISVYADGTCRVESLANLIMIGCCTVPCPPPYVGCSPE